MAMRRQGLGFLLAFGLLLSCKYDPHPPSGALACGAGPGKVCPNGYSCYNNTCWITAEIPATPDARGAAPDAFQSSDGAEDATEPPSDSDTGGGCGGLERVCCADTGNPCKSDKTVCNGTRCVACGTSGLLCCTGDSCAQTGTVCSGARCVACGTSGLPCCAGNSCSVGTTCSGGNCISCGASGEQCCPSSPQCDVPLACAGGTCQQPNNDAGTATSTGTTTTTVRDAGITTSTNTRTGTGTVRDAGNDVTTATSTGTATDTKIRDAGSDAKTSTGIGTVTVRTGPFTVTLTVTSVATVH